MGITVQLNNKKLYQKGQAAVEYVMLISVMALILFSLLGKVKSIFLSPENCDDNNQSFACRLEGLFHFENIGQMKRFHVIR